MRDHDDHADDVLRRVPLPALLRAGVSIEALFDDAAIDRMLGQVDLPAGLAARVRTTACAEDAGRRTGVVDLDRVAATVVATGPVPPQRRSPWRGLVRMAQETAQVVAALSLALLVAMAGIEVSRRLEGAVAVRREGRVARATDRIRRERRPVAVRSETARAMSETPQRAELGSHAPFGPPEPDALAAVPAVSGLTDEPLPRDEAAPAAADPVVRGAPVFSIERGRPPVMRTVVLPGSERRMVPRSAAFDVAFEMAHGEAPFIEPAADAALAVDRPPLTLRTDGFDELLRGRPRRGSGARSRIRVEEVLAAVPPPPSLAAGSGAVRLGLHAVRSGRTVDGKPTVLLEVAAFAAGDAVSRHEPLQATLVIDQSAAGESQGWPRICRSIAALAGRLGPTDRITVVLCGPRPRVALRDSDAHGLATAAAAWETLPATATADLDAGLELVRDEGLRTARTIVVAHAVTVAHGGTPVREAVARWHGGLAAAGGESLASSPVGGLRFVVIDPAVAVPGGQGEPAFGRTAPDATAIRRELLRQVTGHDTLVARECRLDVRFDPRRVDRYRVVGHRQSAVESLAEGPPAAIDLHAGETVRAVYEIVPRSAEAPGLAKATFRGRPPGGGELTLDAADDDRSDRADGLPSPHGCELVLAAWLGELAAGSAHQSQPQQVATVVGRIGDQWRRRGDLSPLGEALLGTLLEGRPPGR